MNERVISDSIGNAYMYFHWDCDFNITIHFINFFCSRVELGQCWARLQNKRGEDFHAQSVCFPYKALKVSNTDNWALTSTLAKGNEHPPRGGNSI